MSKEVIEHKDLLGNLILDTSKLAVSHHNDLKICSIVKRTNKMIRVKPLKGNYGSTFEGYLVYPHQAVVVDGPDVLAYILKA